jgi:putative endonuclease
MYFVYILQIKKSGRYYIGQTQDLAKRLQKHSRGETKSMKNRGEFELVYVEECSTRTEAMRREKEIKRYKGGVAFKRLLSEFDKRKVTIAGLAEVPPKAG